MSIISLFDYFKQSVTSYPLINILHQIKTGKYQKEVEALRKYYELDQDAFYDAQKRALLRFTVSGHFRWRQEKWKMVSYSGYILLEVSYLNEQDMKTVRMLVTADPYVCACFVNALGFGLVFIVKSSAKKEDHKKVFTEVVKYYEELTGVKRFSIDGSSTNHHCLVSYDKDAFMYMGAVPFPCELK